MWRDRPGVAAPTPILWTFVLFQAGVMLVSSIDPGLWSVRGAYPGRIEWMPLMALWGQPMLEAAVDVMALLAPYAALAATLVVVLRRARVAQAQIIVPVTVTALAVAVEGAHSAATACAADTTEPVLALLASAGALCIRSGHPPAGVFPYEQGHRNKVPFTER